MTTNSTSSVRAAIYARVSSDQQAQEQTIESQVAALRERVASDGLILDEELCFLDDGVSGSTLMRPSLERLRDMAYVGVFQKLYVHSPDRLSRRYAYQVLLVDELKKHGVEIEFLNRSIGVSPEEDLLLQMQGMFAEYERAKIMERSRRGKRHAAGRGSVNVLSGAPYGYRYISKRDGGGEAAYEIHNEQAAVVKQVFEWVGRDRLSIGEVTRRLTAGAIPTSTGKSWWDRTTVWAMLKNPAYKGSAAFGKTRTGPRRPKLRTQRGDPKMPRRTCSTYDTQSSEQISIPVPAILSEELFAAVQKQLTENRLRGRERKRGARYLLQGLLECECCRYAYYGKKVSRSSAKGKVPYAYYRCVGTDAYRFGGKRVCENKQVRTDKLDQAVWNDACELLRNPKLLRKEYERRLATPGGSDGEQSLRKQVSHAQRTVNRLIDAYADGVVDREEFEPRIQRARKRLLDFETKLEALQSRAHEQTVLREALECLDSFSETIHNHLDQADWTTRREILRTLVERVVIEPQQIRIVYRINFPLFARKASVAGKEKVLHFCWRRERTSLRRSFRSCRSQPVHHHSRFQERSNQFQQTLVVDTTSHAAHQHIMIDAVKELFQVHVDHPRVTLLQITLDFGDCVVSRAKGPEAETALGERCIPLRRQHKENRLLDHTIHRRRNTQLAYSTVGFRNLHTPDRLGLIRSTKKLADDLVAVTLEIFSSSFTRILSTPGAPPLATTRAIAVSRLSGSQIDSINLSLLVGLSGFESATLSTVPSPKVIGDSLLPSSAKASSNCCCCVWFFCRWLLMSSRSYLPLHLPRLARGTVWAFNAMLRSCEPRLFLPFRVSVSLKRIGFPRLLCPLLTSGVRSSLLADRSVRVAAARLFLSDTRQTSQVKSDNLRRTPAGFTALDFDGWRTLLSYVSSSLQHCLLSDSCSSGRDFAIRFLQTSPHDDALALR